MIRPGDDDSADTFLENVFDRAVDAFRRGEEVSARELGRDRVDSLAQIEEVVDLAREVLARPNEEVPQVPGYQVIREIGRGGMGIVYMARQDRVGGRVVALKTLAFLAPLAPRERDRFTREVDALARLHHPHVITIYDVSFVAGVCAYAMEWVDGVPLSALTGAGESSLVTSENRSALKDLLCQNSVQPLVRVGRDVARALEAVHRAGLLHRDVKPSNILVRRDGLPVLIDFGLVRDHAGPLETRSGAFLGTPAYAAPEQLRGDQESVDVRSDVYSLGVTLFHCLAGRLPFAGSSITELQVQIESGCPPLHRLVGEIPRDLATIVSKAVEADPDLRYESAGQLADDLDALLELRPISARPVSVFGAFIRRCRRSKVALFAGMAGAIAAALLVAGVLLRVLWLPGATEEWVRQARQHLLNPCHWESTLVARFRYGATLLHETARSSDQASAVNRYRRALDLYDRVVRWGAPTFGC